MKYLTTIIALGLSLTVSLAGAGKRTTTDHPTKDDTVIITFQHEEKETQKESVIEIARNVYRLLHECCIQVTF